MWGSPPRVRGKPCAGFVWVSPSGITPACAGKTVIKICPEARGEDHPRVCGENRRDAPLKSIKSGSPPRVRGKQKGAERVKVTVRITPACAGKTRPRGAYVPGRRDHPRVCGENV